MSEIRPGVKRVFDADRAVDAARHVEEELAAHVAAREEALIASGVAPVEARAQARASFENSLAAIRQSAGQKQRAVNRRARLDDLRLDVRYAWRGLVRRPALTLLVVATVAIGVGANTAIFSAVDALLLRPLPFPEPERLLDLRLSTEEDRDAQSGSRWSWPKFSFYAAAQRSFERVAAWGPHEANLTDGESERVQGEQVSAGYLAVLRVQPMIGRGFAAELDARAGVERQVIISHALWRRRFNADPVAVGSRLTIDGLPYDVIGVMPPAFTGLSGRADILVPITMRPANELVEPWSLEFLAVGRLRDGVTPEQAVSETAALGPRIYDDSPSSQSGAGKWGARALMLDAIRVAPRLRESLIILLIAVGFVLLIACVNIANLLLGHGATRGQEVAVRLAIGSRRGRLVRLFLTESLLMALLGGAAALVVASLGAAALRAANPPGALAAQRLDGLGLVRFADIRIDLAALTVALGCSVIVGVLCGLAPALRLSRTDLAQLIKTDSLTSRHRLGLLNGRRALVVCEIALAMILLAGAGLMIRSLANRLGVDSGFNASNVLTVRLAVSREQFPGDSLPRFLDELISRLGALPGVRDVGIADCPPLNGGCNGTVIGFPDRPPVPEGKEPAIGVHFVNGSWFKTLQVPLLRGRLFDERDRAGAPRVIVISQSAARAFWPGEDPLGKQAAIYQGGFHEGAEVIGIVGDVRYRTVDSPPEPDAYIPYAQAPRPRLMAFLRTEGDPALLIPSVRNVVRDLAPGHPIHDARPMASRVAAANAQARLSALLLGLFGLMALALAALGVHGVMSFAVARRTREIGIRMALGADRRDVLNMIVGEGLALAVIGCLIGLAGAMALTRVLSSFLFQIKPTDPATLLAMLSLLVLAVVLASWIPARHATRVDPASTLKG